MDFMTWHVMGGVGCGVSFKDDDGVGVRTCRRCPRGDGDSPGGELARMLTGTAGGHAHVRLGVGLRTTHHVLRAGSTFSK